MNPEKSKLTPRQAELHTQDAATRAKLDMEARDPGDELPDSKIEPNLTRITGTIAPVPTDQEGREIRRVMEEDENRPIARSAMKPTLDEQEERM